MPFLQQKKPTIAQSKPVQISRITIFVMAVHDSCWASLIHHHVHGCVPAKVDDMLQACSARYADTEWVNMHAP